jgi:hypothetical protein
MMFFPALENLRPCCVSAQTEAKPEIGRLGDQLIPEAKP